MLVATKLPLIFNLDVTIVALLTRLHSFQERLGTPAQTYPLQCVASLMQLSRRRSSRLPTFKQTTAPIFMFDRVFSASFDLCFDHIAPRVLPSIAAFSLDKLTMLHLALGLS